MRKKHVKQWIAAVVIMLLGLPAMAWADAPEVIETKTVIGENWVKYPQLEGLEDQEMQLLINGDILRRAEIPFHLITLSTLREGGWGLRVDYEATLYPNVLSLVISADGTMQNGRDGQKYTAVSYDLQTGKVITPDDVFHSTGEAVQWMEETAEAALGDEPAGFMANSGVSPLPIDNFTVDADGITFYYPTEQFSLLSGYGGAYLFYHEELADFLNWEGIIGRLAGGKPDFSDAEIRGKIEETVRKGQMPHVPVTIGDTMGDLIAKYRLVRQPDQYPGGRYYQLEAPQFRQVRVLGEAEGSHDSAKVLGIQSTRGSLYGIRAGETTQERWRQILGDPESTVVFAEDLAYDYSLPVGESDFYTFGDYQLRLHADENGMLHSVQISR